MRALFWLDKQLQVNLVASMSLEPSCMVQLIILGNTVVLLADLQVEVQQQLPEESSPWQLPVMVVDQFAFLQVSPV